MQDYDCAVCGATHDEDNTHERNFVYGGYGSTRYDETKLVWLTEAPEDIEVGDRICDACIDRMVESGALEAFSSVFDPDVGKTMSAEGYARVFTLGAEQMYASCVETRGCTPAAPVGLTPADDDALLALRRRIAHDPTQASSHAMTPAPENGKIARSVGKAHILAGLVLGQIGGETLDVSDAARVFGEKMVEIDASVSKMLAMFDEIGFDGDGATEDDHAPS